MSEPTGAGPDISRADLADAEAILTLQNLAYQSEALLYNDWSIPPLTQTLEEIRSEFSDRVFLKATVDRVVVGSVRAHLVGDTCPVGRLIVHPEFQRRGIGRLLMDEIERSFSDTRRDPKVPTLDVVNSLVHTALLRIPSINALEGDLKESDFQRLIGKRPRQEEKVFSADVVANVLDKLNLDPVRSALEKVIWKAERNKAFRQGSYGSLRCVAIDGWEPFASYHRHCSHCHVRKVQRKLASGEIVEVDQYYHRYVVALLVGPLIDVVLAIEPVRNKLALREAGLPDDTAEGELTAALRLVDSLQATYGSFIDAFVFDGLYPNGPVLTKLAGHGYGAFIVLRNENNEPLKEALSLWDDQAPCLQIEDTEKNLGHVFRHTANALLAVILLWSLTFNLLQLFVYRRLKRSRRPRDPTNTIRHIVEVMSREVASLPAPIPWLDLLDSS